MSTKVKLTLEYSLHEYSCQTACHSLHWLSQTLKEDTSVQYLQKSLQYMYIAYVVFLQYELLDKCITLVKKQRKMFSVH